MRSWLVRLGKFGEDEPHALETGELVLGWVTGDLTQAGNRADVLQALQRSDAGEKIGTLQNWAAQLNQFANGMAVGDLAIVPLKTTGQIAVGRVRDAKVHSVSGRPARWVDWLRKDLPRSEVGQDLLYSLGAIMTVCEVSRNNAPDRFASLARGGSEVGVPSLKTCTTETVTAQAETESVDLGVVGRDLIEKRIAATFNGHGFTELIAAILQAEGYRTRVSPPGADKGVDIVAGQGGLGFDGPRLVVQVKSGGVVADQPTLQSLLGCIQDTHAEHGLLVSWSGFTSAVRARTNDLYFRVRLWGRDEVLNALFANYERMPEDIRAQLPLQRVWTVVSD